MSLFFSFFFFLLSFFFCLCLLSLSELAGQSPRRDSQALCLTSSGRVRSWFASCTYLICLLEPWRRPALASLASRGQSRRIRVIPNSDKLQKMGCTAPQKRSFSSSYSSQPRATSHCLYNRNQQVGIQTQSATSSLDQPRVIGPVPAYWEHPPPLAAGATSQYQPTGNEQASLAEDDFTLLPSSKLN